MDGTANDVNVHFTGYPEAPAYLAMEEAIFKEEWRQWWKRNFFYWLLLICAVIASDMIEILYNLGFRNIQNVVTLLAFVAMWIALPSPPKYLLSKSNRKASYLTIIEQKPQTGWIAQDGIHLQHPYEQTILQWKFFSERFNLNDTLWLRKNKRPSIGFTAAMFASQAEWEQAKQMIENRVG